jgi:hypothetical protein
MRVAAQAGALLAVLEVHAVAAQWCSPLQGNRVAIRAVSMPRMQRIM